MKFIRPEALADGVAAFIYAINYEDYKLIYSNRMAKKAFPDFEIGQCCYEVFFNRNQPCDNCPLDKIHHGELYEGTRWIERLEKWMYVEYHDVESDEGHVCVATGVDVTAVREGEHNTQHVLECINAAAYMVNEEDYRLGYMNRELKNILPSVKEGDLCYKALWDKDEPCSFCIMSHAKGACAGKYSMLEMYNNKLRRHLSINMAEVTDFSGELQAVFTAYDITRRVESEEKLKQMAYMDMQNNIRNRVAFTEDLTEMFERRVPGCLCILNVKYLKKYNLLFGRKAGDELLKKAASFFKQSFPEERVYRVDGAKIGFIAEGQEIAKLRRMVDEAEEKFAPFCKNINFQIHFDAAFVMFPEFAQTPELAVHNVEYLLKKSSKSNQGVTVEFNDTEQRLLNRRNRVEDIVQVGPSTGKFQVYYQPIYDIKTQGYMKCEALLRLYDEELGWISPVEFIPIAEENGNIGELGKFVLGEVCRLLSDRRQSGLSPIKVNVNISPIEFARSDFYENVIAIIEEWDTDPAQIQLEITETVFVNSLETVVEIMNKLIAKGFTFAIDDFGTGYSNLNYIGTMPVECLKLDKSFMDMLLDSMAYRTIVTNVIEIAKQLNISIVAEGIESKSQYELIKSLGSDYIQGFFFSKPLSRNNFEDFLIRN